MYIEDQYQNLLNKQYENEVNIIKRHYGEDKVLSIHLVNHSVSGINPLDSLPSFDVLLASSQYELLMNEYDQRTYIGPISIFSLNLSDWLKKIRAVESSSLEYVFCEPVYAKECVTDFLSVLSSDVYINMDKKRLYNSYLINLVNSLNNSQVRSNQGDKELEVDYLKNALYNGYLATLIHNDLGTYDKRHEFEKALILEGNSHEVKQIRELTESSTEILELIEEYEENIRHFISEMPNKNQDFSLLENLVNRTDLTEWNIMKERG